MRNSLLKLRRPAGPELNGTGPALPDRPVEYAGQTEVRPLEIAPDDPLLPYLLQAPGALDIESLDLDSPTLRRLKEAGVKLVAPLVGQGELIGLLNLGPRLSEQDYSADDRRLLSNLAAQAAPAVRVAQLVREQQAEAQSRERLEQELRVARVIQQTLLPKQLPALEGWEMAAYWQPARAVSGDFYDFINLTDGRLGVVVADVTDKGVPAALLMATARSMLRSAAEQRVGPGAVLECVNELLVPDIPPNMFVTCLYGVLDPQTGWMRFANAGHNLPIRRAAEGVSELRATGMPLGLMPGMTYDEHEERLLPGDSLLIYSDGLVEAHSPAGEMFGFPRLRRLMAKHPGDGNMIEFLRGQLADFTGPGWEQEDDVTFVVLQRELTPVAQTGTGDGGWKSLTEFSIASEPGNERLAMNGVAEVAQGAGLPAARVERLKTAVSEATMNAMEHGNRYRADLPVVVRVLASPKALRVDIIDSGGGANIPEAVEPDLEAKLEGLQSPRGWGLFLIEKMVDEMHVNVDETHHTLQLVFNLKGGSDGSDSL